MLWCCWLGGRKGIRPVKTEWWVAGEVIGLQRGADLHMAHLMPLPLTVSCYSEIQVGFTFLVLAHPGSPGKRAVKRVCVCVLSLPHRCYTNWHSCNRRLWLLFHSQRNCRLQFALDYIFFSHCPSSKNLISVSKKFGFQLSSAKIMFSACAVSVVAGKSMTKNVTSVTPKTSYSGSTSTMCITTSVRR